MLNNRLRKKIAAGEPTLGCFLGMSSPNVAELLAHVGFDWLVIEMEHSGIDMAQVEHMLMAVNGTHATPLVRVPSADPLFIGRALDLGAMGVVVPMVRTAADMEAIVAATRYPPQGRRGFGPLRASHYALHYTDYLAVADEGVVVAIIVETKQALENLDSIVAVPGLNAMYLGLWDLCLAMGLDPRKMPFPETEAAIERVLQVGKKSGVAAGIGSASPSELRRRQEQGFTFLGYGPDFVLISEAARAGLNAFVR